MPGSRNTPRQIISASRRTDIPAFYMDWFMDGLNRGSFDVANPYTQRLTTIPVDPSNTHTLVFWSKNFGPFIAGGYGERLTRMGYHLFFNFTINSTDSILEPHVPDLNQRLDQLRHLADHFNPQAVTWRFDPICHYRGAQGRETNNLADFERIADGAAASGIRRCITSFVDLYPKVLSRPCPSEPGCGLFDPPMQQKKDVIHWMETRLSPLGINLFLCCEHDLLEQLPAESSVGAAACIPYDVLIRLFGSGISRAKDSGQRKSKGCGCVKSRDIGSYRLQPCFHNCLFCYANPRAPRKEGR